PSLGAERIRALSDFELITLTPAIRAERGLVNEQGALIVWISDAGRRIGLREGDLILQINNQPILSADEAARPPRRLAGRSVRRALGARDLRAQRSDRAGVLLHFELRGRAWVRTHQRRT